MTEQKALEEMDRIRTTRMFLDLQERIERLEMIVISDGRILKLQTYLISLLTITIITMAAYIAFQL